MAISPLLGHITPDTVQQVGMLWAVAPVGTPFPTTSAPDPAALPSGYTFFGSMQTAPKMDFGPEYDIVKLGALNLPAGAVVKDFRGDIEAEFMGLDIGTLAFATGARPTITGTGTYVTASTLTVNASGKHVVTLDSVTGLKVGDTLIFDPSNLAVNSARIAIIAGSVVTLDRELRAAVPSATPVRKLTKVETFLGDGSAQAVALAGVIQFQRQPNQATSDMGLILVPEARPISAVSMSFGAGSDPAKTPIKFTGIAQQDTSGAVYTGKFIKFYASGV
jgi:hypothetical protein